MLKKISQVSLMLFLFFAYFINSYISGWFLMNRLLWESILVNIFFIIILIMCLRKTLSKELQIFNHNKISNLYDILRYWIIGITSMISINLIIKLIVPELSSNNEVVLRQLIDQIPFTMAISVIIIAPVLEEFVFRGVLRQIFTTDWLFILISGMVFGIIHVINGISESYELLSIIPYSVMGFVIAYAYYKSKNIIVPIGIHLIHNSVAFLLYISLIMK